MDSVWTRIVFAFRAFFSILLHANIPEDVRRALAGPSVNAVPAATPTVAAKTEPKSEKPPPESFDRAAQLLALLQRDGRLIDFLEEDIAPYPDEQLGAAVRSIHGNCRQVIERYLQLEPVLDSPEERPFTVPTGFDPAAIKLIGNVQGQPPVQGILRHRGWRVKQFKLPALPQISDRMIVAPAEVEVG